MKFPLSSVRASFATCFAPSRNNDTSAPASGLPLLSLTVPVTVPSDFAGAACATPGVDTPDIPISNDTNASQDKLRVDALLMGFRPPRPESLGSDCGEHDSKAFSSTHERPVK